MFSATARRMSSLTGNSRESNDLQRLRRARERQDRQSRDQELSLVKLREQRRRHGSRSRSVNQVCRSVAAWIVLPTVVVIILGAAMTLCSNIKALGVGTTFWESSKRPMYRWLGPIVLLAGCGIMLVNYVLNKKEESGSDAEKIEKEKAEVTEPEVSEDGGAGCRTTSERRKGEDIKSGSLNIAFIKELFQNKTTPGKNVGPFGDLVEPESFTVNMTQNANVVGGVEDVSQTQTRLDENTDVDMVVVPVDKDSDTHLDNVSLTASNDTEDDNDALVLIDQVSSLYPSPNKLPISHSHTKQSTDLAEEYCVPNILHQNVLFQKESYKANDVLSKTDSLDGNNCDNLTNPTSKNGQYNLENLDNVECLPMSSEAGRRKESVFETIESIGNEESETILSGTRFDHEYTRFDHEKLMTDDIELSEDAINPHQAENDDLRFVNGEILYDTDSEGFSPVGSIVDEAIKRALDEISASKIEDVASSDEHLHKKEDLDVLLDITSGESDKRYKSEEKYVIPKNCKTAQVPEYGIGSASDSLVSMTSFSWMEMNPYDVTLKKQEQDEDVTLQLKPDAINLTKACQEQEYETMKQIKKLPQKSNSWSVMNPNKESKRLLSVRSSQHPSQTECFDVEDAESSESGASELTSLSSLSNVISSSSGMSGTGHLIPPLMELEPIFVNPRHTSSSNSESSINFGITENIWPSQKTKYHSASLTAFDTSSTICDQKQPSSASANSPNISNVNSSHSSVEVYPSESYDSFVTATESMSSISTSSEEDLMELDHDVTEIKETDISVIEVETKMRDLRNTDFAGHHVTDNDCTSQSKPRTIYDKTVDSEI